MRRIAILVLVCLFFAPRPSGAQTPEAGVRAALTTWTDNFNSGRADKVCDLFASTLRADVRGAAERDYDMQCRLLRKALADPDHSYNYAFDVKEILADRALVMVRIFWTTKTRDKTSGQVSTSLEQGLDIFSRGTDGQWRIIRYIAYEQP